MRILKILVYVLFAGLILSQLLLLIRRLGITVSYDYGFILGKIIVICVALIVLRVITKYIDKQLD
jgi:uncharacterized protein YebE (UPF0316 family)